MEHALNVATIIIDVTNDNHFGLPMLTTSQ